MNDASKAHPAKTGGSSQDEADKVADDDPHKTEKLTKAGRDDLDPDDGSE